MPTYTFTFPASASGKLLTILDSTGATVDTIAAGETSGAVSTVTASGSHGPVVVTSTLDVGSYTATAVDGRLFYSASAPGTLDVPSSLGAVESVAGDEATAGFVDDTGSATRASLNATYAPLSTQGLAGRINPGEYRAPAPAAPLDLATPDGLGEITHPSVLFFPNGWNGYKYWMVASPYGGGDSTIENPCIYVSNDGATWAAPAGLTNPIDPYPGGSYFNADPSLVMGPGGVLYCFWKQNLGTVYVKYRTTTDGVTWSSAQTLRSDDPGVAAFASQAVLWDAATGWTAYGVDTVASPNVVRRYRGATLAALAAASVETVTVPTLSGREVWHIDVCRVGTQWVMLVQDCAPVGSSGSDGRLYLAVSDDGLTFTVSATQAISQKGAWHAVLYKSALVPAIAEGAFGFELYYAGISAPGVWKIGRTWLRRRDFIAEAAETGAAIYNGSKGIAPVLVSDSFDRADGAIGSAETLQAWTAWGGSPVVASNQAGFSGATNNRAVIDANASDVYVEVTVKAAPSQAYMIFRGVDGNNYWRFGWQSSLQLQKVVAGSATNAVGVGFNTFTAGDKIAVRAIGNNITIIHNGYELVTITDSTHATGEFVGFSSNDAAARFDNFWCRSIVAGR